MSADHIVVLILLLALAVKFVFFEVKDDGLTKCQPGKYAGTYKSKFQLLSASVS